MQDFLRKLKQVDQNWSRITGFDQLIHAVVNNRNLLIYLFAIGLLAYGADIFNFSLNIDSENHAYEFGAKGGWVAQGRWGMYFLNVLLLPDSVMPFIPILMAVTGSVIGAVFFIRVLSPVRSVADFIAAPIAIACPVIYFAFYFTTLGYGVGIAFAATGLGMYWASRGHWLSATAAALCFCFGIAVYQAVLPMIAAMFGLYLISCVINYPYMTFGKMLKHSGFFLFSIILGYVLYAIINKLALYYLEVAYDASYMSNFLHYELTPVYFLQAIEKTWPIAVHYYTGGKDYYLYDLLSLKLLFFFTLTAVFLRIFFAQVGRWEKLTAIFLLPLVILAPMAMHLANNGYMPPRTVMGVPQVLAGLVFFAMGSRSKIVQSITAVLAICCLYNFSVANNRFAFSNYMVWQADRELSVKIQDRIGMVLPKLAPVSNPFEVYPIEIVGWIEYPETPVFIQREVIGASFYKWAAGDVERTERLFRTMGVARYRAATREERLSVIEQANTMPAWPYEGSVDVINGIIVIKFREYNPNQLAVICQPPLDANPICVKSLAH
jgi:hypothetical protein